MTVDEEIWRFMQRHLGYSDEEMALFRARPRTPTYWLRRRS